MFNKPKSMRETIEDNQKFFKEGFEKGISASSPDVFINTFLTKHFPWKDTPCSYCGTQHNTGHPIGCVNRGIYDEIGYVIPATQAEETHKPEQSEEGKLMEVTRKQDQVDLINLILSYRNKATDSEKLRQIRVVME